MSTLSSVSSASAGGATIVTTGGAAGSAPLILQAPQNADVLIVALEHRCGGGAPPAAMPKRPERPDPGAGWCVVTTPNPPTPKAPTASTSSGSKAGSTPAAKSSGPLAFLSDPKMSVEEKLFKFLCYVSDKYDKQLLDKMNAVAAKQGGATGASSSKGLLGGILGGAKSLLGPVLKATGLDSLGTSGVLDLVGQVSGPLLAVGATACGFPELAPVAMKAGSAIASGAKSLLADASKSTGSSASSGSASSKATTDDQVSQTEMLEIQMIQQKQKQMIELVSNVVKGMHDVKMSVIGNLRG